MKILIINSKGHWGDGWFMSLSNIETAIEVLQKAGMEVLTTEAATVEQLEKVLDEVSKDTLLWPNAYFIGDGKEAHWLNKYIEARQLPYIGSSLSALQCVWNKNECQTRLEDYQLPIPNFCIITWENVLEIDDVLFESNIEFPIVLKPIMTKTNNRGLERADKLAEAKKLALEILQDFPDSQIMAEAFLPGDDIACAYVQCGEEVLLLSTIYNVKASKRSILYQQNETHTRDVSHNFQLPITDIAIVNQLKINIPYVCHTLDMRGISRVTGRLDKQGVLRFFDVDGMFALCPDGDFVKQCLTCFPNYSQEEVLKGLLYTLVGQALIHYNMDVPSTIRKHSLFRMQSEVAMRMKIKKAL